MARPRPEPVDMELKLLLIGNSRMLTLAMRGTVPNARPAAVLIDPVFLADVGKSCLLLRFVEGVFTPSFLTTIGVDTKTKIVEVEGKRVRMRVRRAATVRDFWSSASHAVC
ncbi:MAG: hypothetical protein P4L40_22625, partial [Terracidiphilus sp.]|nr:hypothetical protein [Terracidiphilus sp.]